MQGPKPSGHLQVSTGKSVVRDGDSFSGNHTFSRPFEPIYDTPSVNTSNRDDGLVNGFDDGLSDYDDDGWGHEWADGEGWEMWRDDDALY